MTNLRDWQKKASGFNDKDYERFLILLEDRDLSTLTVKSMVRQLKMRDKEIDLLLQIIEMQSALIDKFTIISPLAVRVQAEVEKLVEKLVKDEN
jgi:hypothetical protein